MYNKIVDPITNQLFKINSVKGKRILKHYINFLIAGASQGIGPNSYRNNDSDSDGDSDGDSTAVLPGSPLTPPESPETSEAQTMADEVLLRGQSYIHRATNAADAAAGKNKRKRSLSYEGPESEKAQEELKQKARLKDLEKNFKNMTKHNSDEDGDDTMGGNKLSTDH